VVNLSLPPLRERGDDVIQLAEHLVCVYCKELKKPLKTFYSQALEAMKKHPWPGNVRELQNRLKQAVVLSDGPVIGAAELYLESATGAASTAAGSSLKAAREALEREWVIKALEEHQSNISKAARALGISRPTLYELISRYGL
jgi:two-component system NtrC family response regulator